MGETWVRYAHVPWEIYMLFKYKTIFRIEIQQYFYSSYSITFNNTNLFRSLRHSSVVFAGSQGPRLLSKLVNVLNMFFISSLKRSSLNKSLNQENTTKYLFFISYSGSMKKSVFLFHILDFNVQRDVPSII